MSDKDVGLVDVPVEDHPGLLLLPMMAEPSYPLARRGLDLIGFVSYTTNDDGAQKVANLASAGVSPSVKFKPVSFGRLLAKIAHGFTYHLFRENFEPFLPDVILGRSENVGMFAGCCNYTSSQLNADTTHAAVCARVDNERGESIIVTYIRLFAYMKPRTPVYCVISGRPFQG